VDATTERPLFALVTFRDLFLSANNVQPNIPDTPDNYSHFNFGGGGDTFSTPLALCCFVVALVLICVLPRKYAVVPLLIAGLLIPVDHQIVITGLHFMLYRVLIAGGLLRIICASLSLQHFPVRVTLVDKCVVGWALCDAIAFTLRFHQMGALTNRLGFLYTNLGAYIVLRYLIRDREDVVRTIKALIAIAIVIAPVMAWEHFFGRNILAAVIGGSRLYPVIRDGHIRAQGPFSISIIAGTFGAVLLPLCVGLYWQGKRNRAIAALGIVCCTIITLASSSSTPVLTYGAAVLALTAWMLRRHLRLLRRGALASLILLNLVMKAPVWFLMNRATALTGGAGSGFHRAELIDAFVRRFGEWWLVGTSNNVNWGIDMWDTVNAYVRAGVEGGLLTFILFLAIQIYSYKLIGVSRNKAANSERDARLIWALGAALFTNNAAFFGIIYFDQSVLAWYALLAMICAAPAFIARGPAAPLRHSRTGDLKELVYIHGDAVPTHAARV